MFYFSIEGRLYKLTKKQLTEWEKLFPSNDDSIHEEKLVWIEKTVNL